MRKFTATRIIPVFALAIFVFLACFFFIQSCRKNDFREKLPVNQADEKITTAFFSQHTSTNPLINAVLSRIKRQNNKAGFVPMLAKNAGIPRWDKARVSTHSAGDVQSRNGGEGSFAFIPFVRGIEPRTNALLVVSASTEDTLFKLIYSSQYFTYPIDQAEEGDYWKAKDIFHAFLLFDRDIFSHQKFKVFDERLVDRPYDTSSYVTLEFSQSPSQGSTEDYYYQTECFEYTSCGPCAKARTETANTVFCCDPIILTTCVTYYFNTEDASDWG